MRGLLTDLRLYWLLIGSQIRSQAQYKANVAVDISTYFLVTTLEFAQILVLFATFSTIGGWSVGEVMLLYALTSVSFGLSELFGAGIDSFSDTIRLGEFDRVLLRPVRPFVQIIGGNFRLRRLGRLTQGALSFALALSLLGGLAWTPLKLLVVVAGTLSGTVIFLAILTLGATLCFWTVETTELTNILTYGGREMLSWPLTVYHQALQRFFLFAVPLAFGSFLPACYVLGKAPPFGLPNIAALAAPGVGLVFAAVAGACWRYGVRRYQSTGS